MMRWATRGGPAHSTGYLFCSKAPAGAERHLRQAIFSRDILSISRLADATRNQNQLGRYRPLLELSSKDKTANDKVLTEVSSKDPYFIATTLQWLGWLDTALESPPVSVETYTQIYDQYRQLLGLKKNSYDQAITNSSPWLLFSRSFSTDHLLADLNPSISYCSLSQQIKFTQIGLVNQITRSRPITVAEFSRLISPSLFNTTDLPLLASLLRQHFFPQLSHTLQHAILGLSYAHRFGMVPHALLHTTSKALSASLSQNTLSLGQFLKMAHIFHKVTFYAHAQVQQTQLEPLFSSFLHKMSEKYLSIAGSSFSISSLANDPSQAEQLISLASNHDNDLLPYLVQLSNKAPSKPPSVIDQLISKEKLLISHPQAHTRQAYSTTIHLALSLFVLTGVHTRQLPYSCLTALLNSPTHYNFISKHVALPHLLRTHLVVVDHLRNDPVFNQYHPQMTVVESLLGVARKSIDQAIAQAPAMAQQMLDKRLDRSVLINSTEQTYHEVPSKKNRHNYRTPADERLQVLAMLKNDPLYMQSLMSWGRHRTLQQTGPAGIKVNQWEYPYHYDYKLPTAPEIKGSVVDPLKNSQLEPPSGHSQKQQVRNIKSVHSINRINDKP